MTEEVFSILASKKIFYSYFCADEKYYIFLYSQTIHNFDFFYDEVDVVKQLDFRERQIRSTRGFVLFALEIRKKAKKSKVLKTNLHKFFWENVQRVINQNKKKGLENFLIGKESDEKEPEQNFEIKIENLEGKIQFLENRIIQLENSNLNAPEGPFKAPEEQKNLKEGNSTLNSKKGDFKAFKEISEKEQIEVILRGFRLQNEEQIILKDYYEGDFLFKWKGYNLKYETIRRNALFQKLKREKINAR